MTETPKDPKIEEIMGLLEPVYDAERLPPKLTCWDRADRAASALQTHVDEVNGFPGESYGDEGSDTFVAAVLDLLVDLKHLLYRTDHRLMLGELVEEATDRWAAEADEEAEESDDGEG